MSTESMKGRKGCTMWSDFLSFYFQFYKVFIFESTYAISEGKMQSVFLNIELRS
jgi:hypothetical protein